MDQQPPGGWRIVQEGDALVQRGENGLFAWRYAYIRAQDSREADDPGQDFVTFCQEGERFAFALCDGVSQSFYGEIASRFLGDELLKWLWRDAPHSMDTRTFANALTTQLGTLTEKAMEMVRTQPLPESTLPMLRDVLEQKRDKGSESTFACGLINLPGEEFPHGRVALMWLGDSRLRLWDTSGELTPELGDTFHTRERWSTHKGMMADRPHAIVLPVNEFDKHKLTRVMVYSDGAPELNSWKQPPTDKELNGIMRRANGSPVSDDIAFLEVWLKDRG